MSEFSITIVLCPHPCDQFIMAHGVVTPNCYSNPNAVTSFITAPNAIHRENPPPNPNIHISQLKPVLFYHIVTTPKSLL
jgi:hypothetical protein